MHTHINKGWNQWGYYEFFFNLCFVIIVYNYWNIIYSDPNYVEPPILQKVSGGAERHVP